MTSHEYYEQQGFLCEGEESSLPFVEENRGRSGEKEPIPKRLGFME